MRVKKRNPEITAEEFQALLAELDLGKNDLARLCGVSEKTPQRWVAGDNIPLTVVIILKLLRERPELKDLIWEISEES